MIGRACNGSNACSGPVLIGRGLDLTLVNGSLHDTGTVPLSPKGDTGTVLLSPKKSLCSFERISGGNCGGDTPVPIPNTAVKPSSADGTWDASPRESRSPPELI